MLPDAISTSAAISACAKQGQWRTALQLLVASWSRLPLDDICFNAAISACATAGEWQNLWLREIELLWSEEEVCPGCIKHPQPILRPLRFSLIPVSFGSPCFALRLNSSTKATLLFMGLLAISPCGAPLELFFQQSPQIEWVYLEITVPRRRNLNPEDVLSLYRAYINPKP